MYPWNWLFSPKLYFPLSGDSIQSIAPETHWLFDSIKPEAGDGRVEREVFENVASYGKQLGWLTELIIALADRSRLEQEESRSALPALEKLELLQQRIGEVKEREAEQFEVRVANWLKELKVKDPASFERVGRDLFQILSGERNGV